MKDFTTSKELADMIWDGDITKLAETLPLFGLDKTRGGSFLTTEGEKVVRACSSAAVATAYDNKLTDEVAYELIDSFALECCVFSFCDLVCRTAGITPPKSYVRVFPKWLQKFLDENQWDDTLPAKIAKLSEPTFQNLLAYLAGDNIDKINVRLCVHIARYIYTHKLIPTHLLFAYLPSALQPHLRDQHYGMSLGSLVGMGLISGNVIPGGVAIVGPFGF